MPILSAHIVPHPPIIVPDVGGGRERDIRLTSDSYHRVAKAIAEARPETIVIISPHSTTYSDYFHISGGTRASGGLSRFGAPGVSFDVKYDPELVEAIAKAAKEHGIPAGTEGERSPELDHGTMIPLYFINQYLTDYKLVRMSVSGLDLERHFDYGTCLKEAVGDKNVVLVASGDLSHRLKSDGPYGFNADGPVFDRLVTDAMAAGEFNKFFEFEPELLENAAECGLRAFAVMSGALDQTPISAEFHSYEGTFGVGYALCSYEVLDAHVYLARLSLAHYLETGGYPQCPDGLPKALAAAGHGAFVSLKKHGRLRGCIGTITGVQDTLAMEIIVNAVSAGTKDPRFAPVTADELGELEFSVDVLSAPEPVRDISALDAKKYGVIVSCGHRRGLLLPNLDGVDTVAEQLSIALQKAGIRPDADYAIERFEVVRHK